MCVRVYAHHSIYLPIQPCMRVLCACTGCVYCALIVPSIHPSMYICVYGYVGAVLCCIVLCCTVLWCIVLYCTVMYCTVLCCAALCCTVLCCGVLCCAVLCCAALCCDVVEWDSLPHSDSVQKWRDWNNKSFLPLFSENVYRTFPDALQVR